MFCLSFRYGDAHQTLGGWLDTISANDRYADYCIATACLGFWRTYGFIRGKAVNCSAEWLLSRKQNKPASQLMTISCTTPPKNLPVSIA